MITLTVPHPDPSYDQRHGPARWSETLSDALMSGIRPVPVSVTSRAASPVTAPTSSAARSSASSQHPATSPPCPTTT